MVTNEQLGEPRASLLIEQWEKQTFAIAAQKRLPGWKSFLYCFFYNLVSLTFSFLDTKNYINPDKELHKSHGIEYQEDKLFANIVGT